MSTSDSDFERLGKSSTSNTSSTSSNSTSEDGTGSSRSFVSHYTIINRPPTTALHYAGMTEPNRPLRAH
jgi:hypothetical protein